MKPEIISIPPVQVIIYDEAMILEIMFSLCIIRGSKQKLSVTLHFILR